MNSDMKKEIRKSENVSFIPCGDSMEKMEELGDDSLGTVVGGLGAHIILSEAKPADLQMGSKLPEWTKRQ